MLTAASVMNRVCAWPGTSMTKTWLMRRPVRRPVSRFITAPISSSVCRLPFISSSALPARTSSTAFSAAAWLCGTSTISILAEVERELLGDRADLVLGTDENRLDQSGLARLDGASERGLVARMRHGGRDWLQALRRGDQAVVFLVAAQWGRSNSRSWLNPPLRQCRGKPVQFAV